MIWAHLAGIYLMLGVACLGVSLVTRKRWGEKIDMRASAFWVGAVAGVLFWIIIIPLVAFLFSRKRKSRKLERLLGFCPHYSPFSPYCPKCERDVRDEERAGYSPSLYEGDAEVMVGEALPRWEKQVEKAVTEWIAAHPACRRCDMTGALKRYMGSAWVVCTACGHRVFTADPELPESFLDGPESLTELPETGDSFTPPEKS